MMDFHCHLDLYPGALKTHAEAMKRMEFVWLVTTSPRAFVATSKAIPASTKIRISPGLHPEVASKKASELELLLSQIENNKLVGEVGLDGSRPHKDHADIQRKIFEAVVEKCQEMGGRILSIHSRAASGDVLDILNKYPRHGTAVLHWFTDSQTQLTRATESGCWFSLGPAALQSANGRNLAANMPRDRVVSESDGPFAKVGDQPVMPWEVMSIARRLAPIWGVTEETAFNQLRVNGSRLIAHMQ